MANPPVLVTLPLTIAFALAGAPMGLAQPMGDHVAEFSIVKGQEVSATQYPEVVRIIAPTTDGDRSVCGGTIVDREWILTAAHCFVELGRGSVIVRTYHEVTTHGQAKESFNLANGVFVHPFYAQQYAQGGPTRGKYDVALVKLAKPLDVAPTATLPVVTLPRAGEALPRSGVGTVVGRGAHTWSDDSGYSDTPIRLRKADVPLLDGCHSDVQICAQYPVRRRDIPRDAGAPELAGNDYRNPSSCYGDSGGPLFVTKDGKRQQVGIVSHHRLDASDEQFFGFDLCGRATVWYTSLSYVRPWIDMVMASNLRPGDTAPPVPLPVPPYGATPQPPVTPSEPKPPVTPPSGPSTPQPEPPTMVPVPPVTPQPPAPQPPVPTGAPSTPIEPPAPSQSPLATPAPMPSQPGVLPTLPGDGPLLHHIPDLAKGAGHSPATWALDGTTGADGSDLAIGAARVRQSLRLGQARPAGSIDGKRVALVASESRMADALASGPLQALASLYLTASTHLEPPVLAALQRDRIDEVWILGGQQAISPRVESALRDAGMRTRRIAGQDRVETAIAIAQVAKAKGITPADRTYIARAFGDQVSETRAWADALALGGLAATRRTPIVLTDSERVSPALQQHLRNGNHITVVGGPAAIADQVITQLQRHIGQPVGRLAGQTRAQTAAVLAGQYTQPNRVIVIDGQHPEAWQAGFVLAGVAADLNAPIVLTMGEVIPQETKAVLAGVPAGQVVCIGQQSVCGRIHHYTKAQ